MARASRLLAIFICIHLWGGIQPASAQGLRLRLRLKNESAQTWNQKPVTSGVMLPRGAVTTTASLQLSSGAGQPVAAQFLPTAWWPDHSIRWALVDLQASVGAGATQTYYLQTGSPATIASPLRITQTASAISVTNGDQTFTFNRNEFRPLGREFQVVAGGVTYRAVPFSGPQADAFPSPALPWIVEEAGPLKVGLKSEGRMMRIAAPAVEVAPYIRYRARIYIYAGQPFITVYLTLKNNQSYDFAGESSSYPRPGQNFSAIRFGSLSLVPGSTNLFGAGIEKTWQVRLTTATGDAQNIVVQVNPANAAATRRAEPLLRQDAADIERIGGFGEIIPTLSVTDADLGAVLARYEKTQRAKVAPEDVERMSNGASAGTVFTHMAPQLGNYKDYGDLAWADGWSRNHYDWIYGMGLHWLRTGESRFIDAATIFARHQADLDVYHTWNDNVFYNFMTNWEGAGGGGGNHNNPWTELGGGRPTHTWNQGLMLHWLLTGDRRCRDAAYELIEGARQYLYLAQGGRIMEREVRLQGWIATIFMTGWLVDPFSMLDTGEVGDGTATCKEAALASLQPLLDMEASDGGKGYIRTEEGAPEFRTLYMHYILEPLIQAFEHLLRGTGDSREAKYRALIFRIMDNLRAHYYFGDTTSGGYRPLQSHDPEPITMRSSPPTEENDLAWLLMAANAAAWVYTQRGDAAMLQFARKAFRDFIYYRETDSAARIDPARRAPTGYLSQFYMDSESKIHGWSGRYGQYYLKMERALGAQLKDGAAAGAGAAGAGENWVRYE